MKDIEIPKLDARGLREFGLVTGAIVAGLFGVLLPWLLEHAWPTWPWVVFAVLAIWALVHPLSLNPVYRIWMRIGLLLGRITTPIIMTVVFLVSIFPAAIVMRCFGKDPMRRRFDQEKSYRVDSKQPPVENMDKPY
jgi:hypothetical protein